MNFEELINQMPGEGEEMGGGDEPTPAAPSEGESMPSESPAQEEGEGEMQNRMDGEESEGEEGDSDSAM